MRGPRVITESTFKIVCPANVERLIVFRKQIYPSFMLILLRNCIPRKRQGFPEMIVFSINVCHDFIKFIFHKSSQHSEEILQLIGLLELHDQGGAVNVGEIFFGHNADTFKLTSCTKKPLFNKYNYIIRRHLYNIFFPSPFFSSLSFTTTLYVNHYGLIDHIIVFVQDGTIDVCCIFCFLNAVTAMNMPMDDIRDL